jgi:hypothetical protein
LSYDAEEGATFKLLGMLFVRATTLGFFSFYTVTLFAGNRASRGVGTTVCDLLLPEITKPEKSLKAIYWF